jgi:hypothetical protein
MPIDYTHFDEIGDDEPVPQKLVRKKPHAGPEVVREDFEDDISAYLDGGLPMPPPPPLTDEEKRALLRKSKLKFQAAKDEFGAEATAWHREQLKLAARDRCVYGPGAPGAPCDGGRARVRGGEDLSTWDAAARAAQTKKPAPVPESLDMIALREQAATGDAEAQYRLGARLYEDKKGAEAERFLKLAAAQDHAEACFALGEAYAAPVDDGIRLDLTEALKYFRKAARAGHAAARRRAAFLDDVFREAAAEGPEAPIFDDDDAAAKNDAAAAAAAAHNARMALEGPAAPGIDRGAIREATEALRALGMSSAELRERS